LDSRPSRDERGKCFVGKALDSRECPNPANLSGRRMRDIWEGVLGDKQEEKQKTTVGNDYLKKTIINQRRRAVLDTPE